MTGEETGKHWGEDRTGILDCIVGLRNCFKKKQILEFETKRKKNMTKTQENTKFH